MQSVSIPAAPGSRRHPRITTDLPIGLWHGEDFCLVRAKNLSMTGLLLEGSGPITSRTVRVELRLPSEAAPLLIEGEVVRQGAGVAIRFLDLEWRDILALARYLSPRL